MHFGDLVNPLGTDCLAKSLARRLMLLFFVLFHFLMHFGNLWRGVRLSGQETNIFRSCQKYTRSFRKIGFEINCTIYFYAIVFLLSWRKLLLSEHPLQSAFPQNIFYQICLKTISPLNGLYMYFLLFLSLLSNL